MFAKTFLRVVLIGLLSSAELSAQTRTYTTLSGFYDYQTNNTCQYIRVNPANGNIHVIFQVADDSANVSPSRRTAYAFSSNGGTMWNNFSGIRVPARRSGFPTLDLIRGTICPGAAIIANQTAEGIRAYVDCPEGTGAFSELIPPISDALLWPEIAGAADGSIILAGSTSVQCATYIWRLVGPVVPPPIQIPNVCGGKYVVEANATGRVALVNVIYDSVKMIESANNGSTWRDTTIMRPPIIIGPDTFAIWGSIDFAYLNNEPVVVMALQKINRPSSNDGAAIGFWSRVTGAVLAVPRNTVSGIADTLNRRQSGHLSMGYPVVGISGQYIVLGFQAFMPDTSVHGFNYSEVFWTFSLDGGRNWIPPENLTNTRLLDERYASMSRWNHGGPSMVEANMVWQEDTEPGSHVFDGAPVSRSKQVFGFKRIIWNSAEENNRQPYEFSLSQNYPNPFNPTTNIVYRVGSRGSVKLSVFDVLGRKVATLVNEVKEAGEHYVQFDANSLSSGVYYYHLRVGGFVATKKMLLIR